MSRPADATAIIRDRLERRVRAFTDYRGGGKPGGALQPFYERGRMKDAATMPPASQPAALGAWKAGAADRDDGLAPRAPAAGIRA